jgi:hypothetical protein
VETVINEPKEFWIYRTRRHIVSRGQRMALEIIREIL